MNIRELHARMESKLKAAGLAAESVKVFGATGTCVHIRCIGRDTAARWAALLAKVFGKTPTVVESSWEASENKGTVLKPTMRRGYLVALIVRFSAELAAEDARGQRTSPPPGRA